MCKLKMTGSLKDFVWHDAKTNAASTFGNLKKVLIERFHREPMTVRVEKFNSAKQLESEDVRSYATQIQMLVEATVKGSYSPQDEQRNLRGELLLEQRRSQFSNGL